MPLVKHCIGGAIVILVAISPLCQVIDEGTAIGEVIVVTNSQLHRPGVDIPVAAISDYQLNAAHDDPQKARVWATRRTDNKGFFSYSDLRQGTWHFYAFQPPHGGRLATAYVFSKATEIARPKPIELPDQPQASQPWFPKSNSTRIRLVLYQQNDRLQSVPHASKLLLTGRVSDERGQPVQASSVSIFVQGGDTLVRASTTRTDSKGNYAVDLAKQPSSPEYVLTVAKYGYQAEVKILELDSSSLKQDFELRLEGDFGDIAGMGSADASRRRIFTGAAGRTLEALPLPGSRGLDSLALTSPGIFPPPETHYAEGPSFSPGIGTAGAFTVNGLRSREITFTQDGGDDNDELVGIRRQGFVLSSSLPPEAVQEFQVISALPDARLGRGISAQVNVISKTSFGGLHGSFYNFFTNTNLRARDYFEQTSAGLPRLFPLLRPSDNSPVFVDGHQVLVANPAATRPEFTFVQPGGMIASRVWKMYVFGGVEAQIQRGERQVHFAVPTVDERRLSRQVLNQLPSGSLPVTIPGDAAFSFYPFPNNPSGPFGPNTFSSNIPVDGTGIRWFTRIDHMENPGTDVQFRAGGKYDQNVDHILLPSSAVAIRSMLSSRIANFDAAYYFEWESTHEIHNARISLSGTHAVLSPQAPATFFPDANLLLDVTPVISGKISTPEQYLSAGSPSGQALLAGLGYSGVVSSQDVVGPFSQLAIAGFSPVGIDPFYFPQTRTNVTGQMAYSGSITRSHRTYLFGVEFRPRIVDTVNNANSRPQITFSGLGSIPGSSSLLDGSPAALAAAGLPTGLYHTLQDVRSGLCCVDVRGLKFLEGSVYFQHERSVGSSLRITAGMRLEFRGVSEEYVTSLADLFNRPQLLQDAAAAEAACAPACAGFAAAIAQAFPANYPNLKIASPISFGPRVGFAWRPFASQKWTVRGGFGVYHGVVPGFAANDLRQGFNNFIPVNLANSPLVTSQGEFLLNLANPLVRHLSPGLDVIPNNALNLAQISVNPLLLLAQTLTNLNSFGAPPTFTALTLLKAQQSLANPYSEHYTLTVERQIKDTTVSLAYVGTRGIRLLRPETPQDGTLRSFITLDQIATVAGGFPTVRATLRPPQTQLAGGIVAIAPTVYSSSASSSFHSLQAEFRGRLGQEIHLSSSFTYSHAIDDVSDVFDLAGAFALPQDSIAPAERASASFDARCRLAGTLVWDIAHRQSSRWLGGWQLAGIGVLQSGQPFTVNSTFDINQDGNLTDRLNSIQGLEFGPFPGDPTARLRMAPSVSIADLLAAVGKDGIIGRNTFRSWGVANADMALTKSFTMRGSESSHMLLRFEAFNVLNHPEFAIPVRIVGSPAFGKATQTAGPARTLQAAAKWQF